MTHDEKMIEVVARAMVSALGKDPEMIVSLDEGGWGARGPIWMAYRDDAIKHIAAFKAIREHLRMTGKEF